MNVKELIVKLKKMPPNLEVYGLCDHGQSPEKVSEPSIAYTDDCQRRVMYLDEWTAHEEEAEDMEYGKQFVLL